MKQGGGCGTKTDCRLLLRIISEIETSGGVILVCIFVFNKEMLQVYKQRRARRALRPTLIAPCRRASLDVWMLPSPRLRLVTAELRCLSVPLDRKWCL